MVRGMPLVLMSLGFGCVQVPSTGVADRPIVEWHASEQAYQRDPLREEVLVWADGRIEARFETSGELSRWKEFEPKERRVVLTSWQMDQLFVLLSQVRFLQCESAEPIRGGCPLEPRDPDLVREVLLVYSPRPGLRRELRRCWEDGALDRLEFTPECYARLKRLDGFFQELLWKD
jgi:hypothetical protein